MIDVKRIEEAVKILKQVGWHGSGELCDPIGTIVDLAEQVLNVKVPEKKEIQESAGITMSKSSPVYKFGWNDCHDQFTALIARDYVHRDKLPMEENLHKYYSKEQLTKINGKWQISWIEGERIGHRDLNWYEEIFVLPAKIYFKIFGLKFPKWF